MLWPASVALGIHASLRLGGTKLMETTFTDKQSGSDSLPCPEHHSVLTLGVSASEPSPAVQRKTKKVQPGQRPSCTCKPSIAFRLSEYRYHMECHARLNAVFHNGNRTQGYLRAGAMLLSSPSMASVPSSWLNLERRRFTAVMAAVLLPLMRSGSSLHRAW